MNNIKQTTEDLKIWLQDMPNNNIKTIKLEILNKVAQYLEENKNNNKKLLDTIKNNYEEVFEEICNKPWYELLCMDENFFNEILNKIQTTNGNEQLENIHEFTKSLLTSIRILIQKEENNKLKEINDILDIKAVQQYLSKKCFYFENILKFKDKIKQEQNRSVDFYDFEVFQQFIKEKIQTYLNICQSLDESLEQMKQTTNNQLCISIINKLKQYFNSLQKYCYNQIEIDNNTLEEHFANAFIIINQ